MGGPWERGDIPTTNISKSVNVSWLTWECYKIKIFLYDSCVIHVINAYIQCTKELGYLIGQYLGKAPNMETCLKRVQIGITPSPDVIARVVKEGTRRATMLEEPTIYGNWENV